MATPLAADEKEKKKKINIQQKFKGAVKKINNINKLNLKRFQQKESENGSVMKRSLAQSLKS